MLRKSHRAYAALGWVLFACGMTVTAPARAQSGPIGWWKLDEGSGTSTADASGNGNTGTLTNSPTWISGRVGPGALSFGGTTAYVNVPNSSGILDNLQNTGMTVSAWIKAAGTGGGNAGRIVEKGNWFFAMGTVSSTTVVRFTIQDTAGSRPSSAAVTLNSWVHVAATWAGEASGSSITLYVNGVASNGTLISGTGTVGSESGAAQIGNRASDTARGFNGGIDEVRIYNRVLSAAEIQALADSTPPNAPTALSGAGASSNQINLTWTAPSDNVGVTGYLIERCAGATCNNFAQVGTSTIASYSDAGLSASMTYSYRVRATDANSNLSGYSNVATASTPASGGDTTPPSAPTNLVATNVGSTQVNLTWTASTDNVGVTGYKIERCSGSGCSNYGEIGTSVTTTYSDTTVVSGTVYQYRVRATDAALNLSGYSNVATPSGGDTQAPSVPGNLRVLAASSTEIDLTWDASTDNVGVTGYLLERCAGASCSNFAQIASPPAAPYYDTGLSAATPYSYRIRATDAATNRSAYSTTLSYVTPVASPDCN